MSASLDQTVRVWDISGLRKKTVAPTGEDVLRIPQVWQPSVERSGAVYEERKQEWGRVAQEKLSSWSRQ